jgi:uncharacterized membrane protein
MPLNKVYDVLWGSSPIPDNHIYEILISNLTYIILGAYMILTPTGTSHDDDRYIRAMILILVGFVSTIFHANQVTHGMDDHRTSSFHVTDISIATLAFLTAVYMRGLSNIQNETWYLVVVAIPLYLYNGPYYWLTHSLWHVISAFILFTILDY